MRNVLALTAVAAPGQTATAGSAAAAAAAAKSGAATGAAADCGDYEGGGCAALALASVTDAAPVDAGDGCFVVPDEALAQ